MLEDTITFPVYIGEDIELIVTTSYPDLNVMKITLGSEPYTPGEEEKAEVEEAISAEIEEMLTGGW